MEMEGELTMKHNKVKFKKGMYVKVAYVVSEMFYTEQKVTAVCERTGVIKRIDNEVICVSEVYENTDHVDTIPLSRVIYIIDQHARTSNKAVNRIRKWTANVRNKKVVKRVCKTMYTRIKY